MSQEENPWRERKLRGTHEYTHVDAKKTLVKYKENHSLTDGYLGRCDPIVISDYNPDTIRSAHRLAEREAVLIAGKGSRICSITLAMDARVEFFVNE